MSEESYQPAGYCPKCGYAMDPGKCPECGTEVTAKRLSKITLKTRFWRRVRRGAALAVMLALGYGGYRFYHEGPWPRWLSDVTVVAWANHGLHRVDVEASIRLGAGLLSDALRDQLIDGALGVEVRWTPIVAKNTSMPLQLHIGQDGVLDDRLQMHSGYNHRVLLEPKITRGRRPSEPVLIDGLKVDIQGGRQTVVASFDAQRYSRNSLAFELPALSPGDYVVTIQGKLPIVFHTFGGANVREALAPSVDITHQLTVLDQSLDELVTLEYSDELSAQLLASLELQIEYDGQRGDPVAKLVMTGQPALPLAVGFYRREEFHRIDPTAYPSQPFYFSATDPNGNSIWGRVSLGPTPLYVEPYHVRLHPSKKIALRFGVDRCFGGVIEWSNLQLIPNDPAKPQKWMFRPTKTYPCEAIDGSDE